MERFEREALDRHITGNYGEDDLESEFEWTAEERRFVEIPPLEVVTDELATADVRCLMEDAVRGGTGVADEVTVDGVPCVRYTFVFPQLAYCTTHHQRHDGECPTVTGAPDGRACSWDDACPDCN